MKAFLDEHFLLQSRTAQRLYHDFARDLPIIDFHNHLPADQIADDKNFDNLTEAWLRGDHYKWRAMRANGIGEEFCTGTRPDEEKFLKWAQTVPYTVRNPLYHWTHLELQRYFGVHEHLNEKTAESIYRRCSAQLKTPEYSVRNLLRRMKVQVVCTTDDPVDDLKAHQQLREEGFEIRVVPAFRPDKALAVVDAAAFNTYLTRLEEASGLSISSYSHYLEALRSRHDYFAECGCCVSDHGLEQAVADPYTTQGVERAFDKIRKGTDLEEGEVRAFQSALLETLATWDWEKGWVQQFHIGALRNNNSRKFRELGPDTGWDSIGDFQHARALSQFLDRLDERDRLARTILYNLNPADNEVFATMIGNFNDGSTAGKVQWGSGWWFLDQKQGMADQLNTLSSMGLVSRFVGMLTDSRSFLSFPRHEYFRRVLCNLFGQDIENGELPDDEWIGKVIQDICYFNAAGFFKWNL